MGFGAILA